MKKVFILGSSGSIGVNTLNVIRKLRDNFKIIGLTVNSNTDLLAMQIEEFSPEVVVIRNKKAAQNFISYNTTKCKVLVGDEGLVQAARDYDYDILVSALVGFAGLIPTIEGLKRGKRIALANKETLVAAGEIINSLLKENESEIIPVDSEHSAIFQCLVGEEPGNINKLILTASGGPFLKLSREKLKDVTVKDALNHPNWSMGDKITIDSATMMNKGLEVIEAHWLFGLPIERIDIVIHPQSIVHSMVEFVDNSIKAQLSLPDMKLPIQYALTYPERLESEFVNTNFARIKELTFFEADFHKFECLKLAYQVLREQGTAACTLNAANEVAVDKFLRGQINFLQIPEIIKRSLDEIENQSNPDLETILECDRLTRNFANNLFK